MAESKKALKIVKKKWVSITASKFFNNELLGECYVVSSDLLMGRTVSANLANLTGDIRQQSITLKFLVTSVEGETGVADVVGYAMAASGIRRMVRRGSDRIDESFICDSSEGQKLQIKPMLITKTITNSAVHHSLRQALIGSLAKMVKRYTFNALINEVITSKLQMALKTELKKIYPLKSVEIKSLWLKSAEKAVEAPIVEAAQAPATEESAPVEETA
jgi:small subunit ribosomal protein S3Ae